MWILSLILQPFVYILVKLRVQKNLDDPIRFKERFGVTNFNVKKPVVWFHGASIGESLALLSLMNEWRKLFPNDQLLITTVTKTSADVMKRRMPEGCIHQYVPFDILFWVKRFIRNWKPKVLVIAESDLWPNMIREVNKTGAPIYVVNGKVSDKSFKFWSKIPRFSKSVFSCFKASFVLSEEDLSRYQALGARHNVMVLPNIKYAADPLPYVASDLSDFQNAWIAVSTHSGEEEFVIEWHKRLRKEGLLCILIPRHPVRAKEIAALIKAQGFSVSLRSEGHKPRGDFYIVDTLGEVGLFFSLKCPVLMGGTLANVGGHNPIEPVQMGCQVILGPYSYKIDQIANDLGLLKGNTYEETFLLLEKSFNIAPQQTCLAMKRKEIMEKFFNLVLSSAGLNQNSDQTNCTENTDNKCFKFNKLN